MNASHPNNNLWIFLLIVVWVPLTIFAESNDNEAAIRKQVKRLTSKNPADTVAAIEWLAVHCPPDNSELIRAAKNKKTAAAAYQIAQKMLEYDKPAIPVLQAIMKSRNVEIQSRTLTLLGQSGADGHKLCAEYLNDTKMGGQAAVALIGAENLEDKYFDAIFDAIFKNGHYKPGLSLLAERFATAAGNSHKEKYFKRFAELLLDNSDRNFEAGYVLMRGFLSAIQYEDDYVEDLAPTMLNIQARLEKKLVEFGKKSVKATRRSGGEGLDEYTFKALPVDSREMKTWFVYFLMIKINSNAPYIGFMTDYIGTSAFNVRSRMIAATFLMARVSDSMKLAVYHRLIGKGDLDAQMYAIRKMSKEFQPDQFVPILVYYVVADKDLSNVVLWRLLYQLHYHIEDLAGMKFPINSRTGTIAWKQIERSDPKAAREIVAMYWKKNKDKFTTALENIAPNLAKLTQRATKNLIQDSGTGKADAGNVIILGNDLDL